MSRSVFSQFYSEKPKPVIEICGDGLNLGMLECDDGNTANGDGCNSDCKIEPGFVCHKQGEGNGPDICEDVAAPAAVLKVFKRNTLEIKFSEAVTCAVPTKQSEFKETLEIELLGVNSCPITWSFADHYNAYEPLTALSIKTAIPCTIKGKAETFRVTFKSPHLVQDMAGNSLSTPVLTVNAIRQVYISDTEKAVIDGAGTAFSITSFLTLILFLLLSMLQSVAVGAFWAFINMLQLLSYLPIIDGKIPTNLELFLTQYLSVSKVAFPFSMFPNWVPSPNWYTDWFVTNPVNERFQTCGYQTRSFAYNFSDQIGTWIFLAIFYGVLHILIRVLSESK